MAEKPIKITTPVGVAMYPKLNKPDTKYKDEGEYSIKLRLTPEEAAPLQQQFDAEMKSHYEDMCKQEKKKTLKRCAEIPFTVEKDKEGNETGFVLVKFGMKAVVAPKGKEAWTQRPIIYDSKLKPTNALVGGGSKVKVAGEYNKWYSALGVGISFRLKAVQVIDLVAPGVRSGEDFGFGEEDGSFTSGDVDGTVADSGSGEVAADGTKEGTPGEAKAHGNF